jgi:hypothetical protein
MVSTRFNFDPEDESEVLAVLGLADFWGTPPVPAPLERRVVIDRVCSFGQS